MIDWNKSAELNGMSVDDLKVRFERFPSSAKKIIRICDDCGEERELCFCDCRDLCPKCVRATSKFRSMMSKILIEFNKANPEAKYVQAEKLKQFHIDNPEVVIEMSARQIQFYIDNPEARDAARLKSLEQWSSQSSRDAMSEIKKNSESTKVVIANMRGGNDIVNHHYLYDDADLSKYTMPMTRSEHSTMHHRMKRDGYEVPYINSDTDDNGLWGYN